MQINKYYKQLATFLLLNTLLGVLFFHTLDSRIGEVTLGTITPKKIIYQLTTDNTINTTNQNNREYPFVSTPPSSPKYTLTVLKEQYELHNLKHTDIFFAAKRISELKQWGNELPVLHSYKDVTQFKEWWRETQPNIWEYHKKNAYNSWEATLARYLESIDKEIFRSKNSHDSQPQLKLIRKYLETDYISLKKIIIRSTKSKEENNYLDRLITDIFNSYNDQLYQKNDVFDPTHVSYSLEFIEQLKETGIFNATVDKNALPNFTEGEIYMTIDRQKEIPQFSQESNRYVFEHFQLHKTKELALHFPFSNIMEDVIWQEMGMAYRYQLPPLQNDYTYLFTISTRLKYPIHIEITQNDRVLLDNTYLGNRQQDTFQSLLVYGNTKNGPAQITLTPDVPLTTEEFNSVKLRLQTIYRPPITIEKVDNLPSYKPKVEYIKLTNNTYKIDVQNTNAAQDLFISKSMGMGWKVIELNTVNKDHYLLTARYGLNLFWLSLWILETVILLFQLVYVVQKKLHSNKSIWIDKLYLKITAYLNNRTVTFLKSFKKTTQYLRKQLVTLSQVFRVPLIIVVSILVLITVLFSTFQSDVLKGIICILYLIISLGWKKKINLHFLLVIVFLILSLLFQILHLDTVSENFAVWAFLFLILGTIHLCLNFFLDPQSYESAKTKV